VKRRDEDEIMSVPVTALFLVLQHHIMCALAEGVAKH
jgi:ABC-type maltose transport system permease subunit